MRKYLLAIGGVALVFVAYAPLTGQMPKRMSSLPNGHGFEAPWKSEAPPYVVSSNGPTLTVLVETNKISVGDSRTNDVITFAGHDWRRLGQLLEQRKQGLVEPMRLELATRGAAADQPVQYGALVAAISTVRGAGYDYTLTDETRLVTPMP